MTESDQCHESRGLSGTFRKIFPKEQAMGSAVKSVCCSIEDTSSVPSSHMVVHNHAYQ